MLASQDIARTKKKSWKVKTWGLCTRQHKNTSHTVSYNPHPPPQEPYFWSLLHICHNILAQECLLDMQDTRGRSSRKRLKRSVEKLRCSRCWWCWVLRCLPPSASRELAIAQTLIQAYDTQSSLDDFANLKAQADRKYKLADVPHDIIDDRCHHSFCHKLQRICLLTWKWEDKLIIMPQ